MAKIVTYGDDVPRCSFCGKTEHEVSKLITGPGVAICEECIALCVDIISDEKRKDASAARLRLVSPSHICEYLDRYVIGQQDAKRALAVAVYNHYKRVNIEMADEARELEERRAGAPVFGERDADDLRGVKVAKSNILMIGPTGTGKTYLASTLAKVMNVPFAIVDATTLTEAGYVGDDVETVLQRLIEAADGDVRRAEHGIIYIDEIDKIARKTGENTSITRDVSGEGVQQALLKIVEGTVATVPMEGTRKHREQEQVKIDTRNILFICGGAFVGLEDIVRTRMGRRFTGFGADWTNQDMPSDDILSRVTADDLEQFGLLPEFIGRLPVVTTLHGLDAIDLARVLAEPRNCLVRQYRKLFAAESVKLTFTKEAIAQIAQTALDRGTGARGLRSIMEQVLQEPMFEIPDRTDVAEVIVTQAAVQGTEKPRYVLRDEQSTVAIPQQRQQQPVPDAPMLALAGAGLDSPGEGFDGTDGRAEDVRTADNGDPTPGEIAA